MRSAWRASVGCKSRTRPMRGRVSDSARGVVATLGLEEADSKMHVQRTGSGYEAVQTDVGAKIPNVQYSYRSLRRRSDEQAGKNVNSKISAPPSQEIFTLSRQNHQ